MEGFNEEAIAAIKKAYSAIKTLDEEKKSLGTEIREIKIKCSKDTGFSVKDINGIIKVIKAREDGTYSEDYNKVAKSVLGTM